MSKNSKHNFGNEPSKLQVNASCAAGRGGAGSVAAPLEPSENAGPLASTGPRESAGVAVEPPTSYASAGANPARRVSAAGLQPGSQLAGAGSLYGYARVSSRDQNLARQLDALREFGVPAANTFTDKASGKDFERPAWHALMDALAPGDVLAVKSIDRLGRNYEEILDEWRRIVKTRGAAVVVLDMPLLDTRERDGNVTAALVSDIVLQLLSYVAQVERENIKQRQAEGIAAAKARGVQFGRPKKPRPRTFRRLRERYLQGKITRIEAAKQLNICPRTFDRWVREDVA